MDVLAGRRPVVVDYGGANKGSYYTTEGMFPEVDRHDDLEDLLADVLELEPDDLIAIIIEPTFLAYEPERRDLFIKACADADVPLLRIADRGTPKARNQLADKYGREDWRAKSDENDTRALYYRVHELGQHVSPAYLSTDLDKAWVKRVQELNHRMMVIRRTGQRRDFIAEQTRDLPPGGLPEHLRVCLLRKDGQYLGMMAAVCLAAREARTRDEFDRFLGLYQNAFACQLRAEVWFTGPGSVGFRTARDRGVEKGDFRRALRQFYHLLPRQGSHDPASGQGLS